MPRKYSHIKLPEGLIGPPAGHTPQEPHGFPQNLPGFPDQAAFRQRLTSEVSRVKEFGEQVTQTRRLESDKQFVDLKLKFQGMANKDLIKKYGVSIYAKYDETPEEQEHSNEVILGKVSNQRLPNQDRSSFEQLSMDLDHFIQTNEGRSKFALIEELAPLDIEEVVEPELMDKLDAAQGGDREYVDVIFGDSYERSEEKFADLKEWLGDKFITKVNTEFVHYCRVLVTKDDLEEVVASYSGIIGVDEPVKLIITSGTEKAVDASYELINEAQNELPILILDHSVNTDHPFINPASEEQVGEPFATGGDPHGTQTASLVIYGSKLNSGGKLKLDNKVRPVNVFPMQNGQPILDENVIIKAVTDHSSQNRVLIANFSVNAYFFYNRKRIHRLTVLFDELSVKHNCIFVVSVGNLFTNWPQGLVTHFIDTLGYPAYFDEPITSILPPSDGLNPMSVGSITYQSSPNSIAGPKEPSPITRRGFLKTKGYCLVKPDLVHYDSNFDSNFNSEDNGPFMAHPNGGLVRAPGTSFATPLVAHDLGVLAQKYPDYSKNSLKALLIHFAQPVTSSNITNPNVLKALTGHGIPDLDRALESLNTSSTIVIEDSIKINTRKRVKVPIPASLAASSRKRLRLRKTLVYDPIVNPIDPTVYNPICLTARIIRSDDQSVDNATTQSYLDGAAKKSNVKTYPVVEKNTRDFTGVFWEVEVIAEAVNDTVDTNMIQNYSVILTIEDIAQDDGIDIHQEISQMIDVEVGVAIEVES